MNWETAIAALVVIIILGSVSLYLYKAKKRGTKCIGCPDGAACSGQCSHCAKSCGCCHDK